MHLKTSVHVIDNHTINLLFSNMIKVGTAKLYSFVLFNTRKHSFDKMYTRDNRYDPCLYRIRRGECSARSMYTNLHADSIVRKSAKATGKQQGIKVNLYFYHLAFEKSSIQSLIHGMQTFRSLIPTALTKSSRHFYSGIRSR